MDAFGKGMIDENFGVTEKKAWKIVFSFLVISLSSSVIILLLTANIEIDKIFFDTSKILLLNEKDRFRSEIFELGISPSVVSKTGKKSNDSFWFAYSCLLHTKLISLSEVSGSDSPTYLPNL